MAHTLNCLIINQASQKRQGRMHIQLVKLGVGAAHNTGEWSPLPSDWKNSDLYVDTESLVLSFSL